AGSRHVFRWTMFTFSVSRGTFGRVPRHVTRMDKLEQSRPKPGRTSGTSPQDSRILIGSTPQYHMHPQAGESGTSELAILQLDSLLTGGGTDDQCAKLALGLHRLGHRV